MGSKKQINFAANQARPDASPCPNAASAVRRYDPTGARLFISPLAIAQQRQATLQSFNQLKTRCGIAKAAAMVGSSVVTLWRWQKAFAARGLAGLQPKPASGGRRSPISAVRFSAAAVREIERLTVATGNARAAWRQFAGSPLCPPLVARHILKTGTVPARLVGIGRVNPVSAACYLSADGRRLLVRSSAPSAGAAVVTLKLATPTKATR